LDLLVDELAAVDQQYLGMNTNEMFGDTSVIDARKDYIKANVEFYQALILQDGEASTFEDAVRQQFQTEIAYRNALQPLVDAERNFYEAINTAMPSLTASYNSALEAAQVVREREITYLFPRQLEG